MNTFEKPMPSWLETQRVRREYATDQWIERDSLRHPARLVELFARIAQLFGWAILGFLCWLIGRGLGVW